MVQVRHVEGVASAGGLDLHDAIGKPDMSKSVVVVFRKPFMRHIDTAVLVGEEVLVLRYSPSPPSSSCSFMS